MKNLRIPIRWTDQHSIKYSFLLALAGYSLTIILQLVSPNKTRVGLPDFLGAYSFIAATLGLLIPQILVVIKRIVIRLLPRPGALAFDRSTIRELSDSFEFDRTRVAGAMVPDHLAMAQPAGSSRQIHLGDASVVLDETQESMIRQFIGHPTRFGQISNTSNYEHSVLMITGEPGAGKSVLVQEIHATLSTGVEKGYHSFIPVLLFARDLTLQSLKSLLDAHPEPMQGLVVEHYEKLLKNHPMGSQLKSLYQMCSAYWKVRDFLVIIDGLDEIAQRSAYEKIQTALAKIVQKDLQSDAKGTHRYILTCRVDEDLEIFNKARCIRLRGLSPDRRRKFWNSQLKMFELSTATKNSLERALGSQRIVPSHVFARNPYFLALLIRHLKDDQEHVRQETIDFDFLMRRYLEREAVRPHATVKPDRQFSVEERHLLFNELERLSRAPLQFLAFRSAISAHTTALYDEKPIDSSMLQTFCDDIGRVDHSDTQNLWFNLKSFFKLITGRPHDANIINSPVSSGILNHLHENDLRIMLEVAQAVESRSASTAKLIKKSLGRIRVLALTESEEWYDEFTIHLAKLIRGFTRADQIKVLFFIRGVAAAHLLRILSVSLAHDSVRVRFRHRRLAEYYAACYARDRWVEVEGTLALTPWINPVLNLAAALEGPRNWVLTWLINLLESGPELPLFKWRYMVESAVEASFFSEPSDSYEGNISRLCVKVINVLRNHTSASLNPTITEIDPITETALLRALPEIASLRSTFRKTLLAKHEANEFYQYQASVGPEWMSLIVESAAAVERLSNTKQPTILRLKTFWRLIEQPLPLVLEGSKVFRLNPILWSLVLASMILSEIVLLVLVSISAFFIFQVAANWLGAAPEDTRAAVNVATGVVLGWRILARIQSWMRSPLEAALKSAGVWRLIGRMPLWVKRTSSLMHEFISWLRASLSLRGLAKFFAAFVGLYLVLFLLLAGLGTLFDKGSVGGNLKPCPEMAEEHTRILNKYAAVPKNLEPSELWKIRVQLRDDLAMVSAKNVEKCGFKEDDGGWVLTEERVVDELIERDSRLVPAPDPSLSAWSSDDSVLLNQSLTSAPEAPKPGLVGAIATLQREREVKQYVESAKSARSRVIAARRAGMESFATDKTGDRPASAVITNLSKKIAEQEMLASQLRDRRNRVLLTSIWIILICAMVPWFVITLVRQRKNRRWMMVVRDTTDVHGLLQFVMNKNYSDKVRSVALERLEEVGIQNQDDLGVVETYVGRLYASTNAVDRSLAIRCAAIARALSKRLSHRP